MMVDYGAAALEASPVAWGEARPHTIGSSDVASIVLGPHARWGSEYATWCRVMGLTPRYSSDYNDEQSFGHMMEPWHIAKVQHILQTRPAVLSAVSEHEYLVDGQLPSKGAFQPFVTPGPSLSDTPMIGPESWMHARPDGMAAITYTMAVPVEAKSITEFGAHEDWGPTGLPLDQAFSAVPIYYQPQIVWQMAVTRAPFAIVSVLFGAQPPGHRLYLIPRNMKRERFVVGKVRGWYERHIEGQEPPAIDGSEATRKALAARAAYPDKSCIADAECVRRIAVAARLKRRMAELQRHYDTEANMIRAYMGPCTTLVSSAQEPLAHNRVVKCGTGGKQHTRRLHVVGQGMAA